MDHVFRRVQSSLLFSLAAATCKHPRGCEIIHIPSETVNKKAQKKARGKMLKLQRATNRLQKRLVAGADFPALWRSNVTISPLCIFLDHRLIEPPLVAEQKFPPELGLHGAKRDFQPSHP